MRKEMKLLSKKPIHVDIWGSCVSRDIISLGGISSQIIVDNFIQDCSFPIQFTNTFTSTVKLNDYSSINTSKFFKKMYCYDWNKNVIDVLESSSAKWLIVDMHVMNYYLVRILNPMGNTMFLTNTRLEEKLFGLNNVNPYYLKNYSVESIDEKKIKSLWDRFISFCRKRYGRNIILVQVKESKYYIDKNGQIQTYDGGDEWTINEFKWERIFYENLKPFVVYCPDNMVSDEYHRWGLSHVHYIHEYYTYAACEVVNFLLGLKHNSRIDEIYVKCSQIIGGTSYSKYNIYMQLLSAFQINDYVLINKLIKSLNFNNEYEMLDDCKNLFLSMGREDVFQAIQLHVDRYITTNHVTSTENQV